MFLRGLVFGKEKHKTLFCQNLLSKRLCSKNDGTYFPGIMFNMCVIVNRSALIQQLRDAVRDQELVVDVLRQALCDRGLDDLSVNQLIIKVTH